MSDLSILEQIVKRDRAIVIGGLITVLVVSWVYILLGAGMGMSAFEMTRMSIEPQRIDMGGMAMEAHSVMSQTTEWTLSYAIIMFFMWWVMMVAMMIPSASPMILLFAAINRKQRDKQAPYVDTIFLLLAISSPGQDLASWQLSYNGD